tara:strand:+ start:89 stop:1096 length:1008 start_codon:yes stop_codon:yes gene_type:complete
MKKLFALVFLFSFLSTYSQVRIGSYDGDSHAVVYNNGWGNGDSYIHIGNNAGVNANNTGTYFTNIGYAAGRYNSSMNFNVHLGYAAGNRGTNAIKNVAIGAYAMYADSGSYMTGDNSTSVGHESMYNISSGYNNSGLGYQSFHNLTTGYNNTAIGNNAGDALLTGYHNTFLGNSTDASSTSAINQTMIGYAADGQGNNTVTLGNSDVTAIYMAEDSGATIYAGNATFGGDVTISSDIRLKSNIVSLGSTLSKLLLIDGKSYTMNSDGKDKIGVLAQEVQEVFPELVGEDTEGMLTVNYQGLVPVLINALKEQESKINDQQNQIDELKNLVNRLLK